MNTLKKLKIFITHAWSKSVSLNGVETSPYLRLKRMLDEDASLAWDDLSITDAVNKLVRGIESGDVVRIFNDRGVCLAVALASDAVMPGVVQLEACVHEVARGERPEPAVLLVWSLQGGGQHTPWARSPLSTVPERVPQTGDVSFSAARPSRRRCSAEASRRPVVRAASARRTGRPCGCRRR